MLLKINPLTLKVQKSNFTWADAVDADIMLVITIMEVLRGYIKHATSTHEINEEVPQTLALFQAYLEEADRDILDQAFIMLAKIARGLWI